MLADDIKQLRKQLGCTARDLAGALGVDQKTVLSWERGESFATKRHVTMMKELAEKGPGAIVKRTRGEAPIERVLADPEFWRLVQKLALSSELRAKVKKLAADVPDPEDDA